MQTNQPHVFTTLPNDVFPQLVLRYFSSLERIQCQTVCKIWYNPKLKKQLQNSVNFIKDQLDQKQIGVANGGPDPCYIVDVHTIHCAFRLQCLQRELQDSPFNDNFYLNYFVSRGNVEVVQMLLNHHAIDHESEWFNHLLAETKESNPAMNQILQSHDNEMKEFKKAVSECDTMCSTGQEEEKIQATAKLRNMLKDSKLRNPFLFSNKIGSGSGKKILVQNDVKFLDRSYYTYLGIKRVPKICFRQRILNLGYNEIETINPSDLGLYGHVKALSLGYNPNLRLQSGIFKQSKCLEDINLKGINARNIPENLFQAVSGTLVCLNLSDNQLKIWPEAINSLHRLKDLDLSDNQLEIWPAALNSLHHLEYISLNKNKLTALPKYLLTGLEKLHTLRLKNNAIRELPDRVFSTLLRGIQSNEKQLCSSEHGNRCCALKYIHLDGNKITNIEPRAFEGVEASIRTLDLSSNYLTTLARELFSGMEQLEYLWLEKCNIRELPPRMFEGCRQLTDLYLSGNPIREIYDKSFEGLESLRQLKLANCTVNIIGPNAFRCLTSLYILSLKDNDLDTIPHELFSQCAELGDLYLDNNSLSAIHSSIFGPKGINYLSLLGNPIEQLDSDMLKDVSYLRINIDERTWRTLESQHKGLLLERKRRLRWTIMVYNEETNSSKAL